MVIRFIAFFAVFLLHFHSGAMDGIFSQANRNELHIASLDVGSGECHVVRYNNRAVIIDAGRRGGPVQPVVVSRLRNMLAGAELVAIFLTHSHNDHINLVQDILDDCDPDNGNIAMNRRFRLFAGGTGGAYPQFSYYDGTLVVPVNGGNWQCRLGPVSIRGRDISLGQGFSANELGAVVTVRFGNRIVAFLGDINQRSLERIQNPLPIYGYNVLVMVHNFVPAWAGRLWNEIINADIVTAPHHASLANSERGVYDVLLSNGVGANRVFVASASSALNFGAPHIEPNFIGCFCGYTPVPNHDIQAAANPPALIQQTVPLFSTESSDTGFVWTYIDANGDVFVDIKPVGQPLAINPPRAVLNFLQVL